MDGKRLRMNGGNDSGKDVGGCGSGDVSDAMCGGG